MPGLPKKIENMENLRVGVIGFSGMGRTVVRALQDCTAAYPQVVCVLVKPKHLASLDRRSHAQLRFTDDIQELLNCEPHIIAECAGHSAVRLYGERILSAGINFVVISSGALADRSLYKKLHAAAGATGARLYVPSGAVGGIDALHAASIAGISKVRYQGRKPPLAWVGTPAEKKIDLQRLVEAKKFYSGSARDAALSYPKNSNVVATVALAGIGFDDTQVELISDPNIVENKHDLMVQSVIGEFHISLSGRTLPDNAKTSALAAYSVVKCLRDRTAVMVL